MLFGLCDSCVAESIRPCNHWPLIDSHAQKSKTDFIYTDREVMELLKFIKLNYKKAISSCWPWIFFSKGKSKKWENKNHVKTLLFQWSKTQIDYQMTIHFCAFAGGDGFPIGVLFLLTSFHDAFCLRIMKIRYNHIIFTALYLTPARGQVMQMWFCELLSNHKFKYTAL